MNGPNEQNHIGTLIGLVHLEKYNEMHAILSDYGLPLRFPDEVEAAAAEIEQSITEEKLKKKGF